MSFYKVSESNIEELKKLRDMIAENIESYDVETPCIQKLKEDLWDLIDEINRYEDQIVNIDTDKDL